MPKIKTSELTDAALDWAVATVEKLPIRRDPMGIGEKAGTYWVWPEGWPVPEPGYMRIGRSYSPSTSWAQGGPIIERERVCVDIGHDGVWLAYSKQNYADDKRFMHSGPTPLIAAMRCYCSSKLGDEVEIPEELTP